MKILFLSKKAYKFYNAYNKSDLIIDYFDIEVQKILNSIGFKYKRNPIITFESDAGQYNISKIIDLDTLTSIYYVPNEVISVIYDCF